MTGRVLERDVVRQFSETEEIPFLLGKVESGITKLGLNEEISRPIIRNIVGLVESKASDEIGKKTHGLPDSQLRTSSTAMSLSVVR